MLTSKVINILHIKLARFVIFISSHNTQSTFRISLYSLSTSIVSRRGRRHGVDEEHVVGGVCNAGGRHSCKFHGVDGWKGERHSWARVTATTTTTTTTQRDATPPKMTVNRIECPI